MREDLFLQYKAREAAQAFNRLRPPKQVEFVHCAAIYLRKAGEAASKLYLLEPFMEGEYVKYSNNNGWESSERSTPHAFSHFSYEYNNGEMVIVDMQGVGDRYTDPGIHTIESWWENSEIQQGAEPIPRYGAANFGEKGIAVFRNTHRCHTLCEDLLLKPLNRLGRMRRTTTSHSLLQLYDILRTDSDPRLQRLLILKQQQQQRRRELANDKTSYLGSGSGSSPASTVIYGNDSSQPNSRKSTKTNTATNDSNSGSNSSTLTNDAFSLPSSWGGSSASTALNSNQSSNPGSSQNSYQGTAINSNSNQSGNPIATLNALSQAAFKLKQFQESEKYRSQFE